MRQITAAEVKPGMEVRWDSGGITYQCKVDKVSPSISSGFVILDVVGGSQICVRETLSVTVLSELQPEEPPAVGARVKVGEHRFIRVFDDTREVRPWFESRDGLWVAWKNILATGQVAVIDADPSWAAPGEAEPNTEVPERIEEWPEDDTALRPYQWEDIDGCPWRSFGEDDWRFKTYFGDWSRPHPTPADGPWTRVSDA